MSGPDLWRRTNDLVVRHRAAAVVLSLAITALCVPFAPAMPFSGDITDYLPRGDPYVKFWLDMTRRFDGMNVLMVGLEEPASPLTIEGVARLDRITKRLDGMKSQGILWTQSVTNVESTREGEDGVLNAEMFMPAVPADQAGRDAFAAKLAADTQVRGALVSRDLMGYLVILRIDPRKDVREITRTVQEAVEQERGPLTAHYFGVPFFSKVVTSHVFAKLAWIVPLFVLLLLVPMAWRIRRPGVVALVLFSASAPLLWWLALMRLTGQALSATSLNAMLILPAVAGVAFSRVAERGVASPGESSAFPGRISLALLSGSFACFMASRVTVSYLSEFLLAVAVGLASLVVFGLLFVAPAVSWFRPATPPATTRPLASAAAAAATVVLALIGLFGATRIQFFIAPQDMFSKDDEIGKMISFFDRRFGGNDLVQVSVQGDLRDPSCAARLMRFTDIVEGSGAFADTRSITQVLGYLAQGFGGLNRIPPTREELGNLWFFLEGRSDVRSLVTDGRNEAMVVLRIPSRPAMGVREMADFLRDVAARSNELGAAVTARRIVALARLYGTTIEPAAIDAVLDAARLPPSSADDEAISAKVVARLDAWLHSPDSPFVPAAAQWRAIAEAVRGPTDGFGPRLAAALAGPIDLAAGGPPPDVPPDLVETLVTRERDIRTAVRAAALTYRLWPDDTKVPPPLAARAQGAIAEIINPPQGNGADLQFRVSGFPILAGGIAELLRTGIFVAALLLAAAGTALVLILTMDLVLAAAVLVEALIASLLTFALGWATGAQIDPSSGTIYLLPAILTFVATARLFRRPDGDAPHCERFAGAFTMGFALAALPLLTTGIMPVTRLGAVVAIALVTTRAVTAISGRVVMRRRT